MEWERDLAGAEARIHLYLLKTLISSLLLSRITLFFLSGFHVNLCVFSGFYNSPINLCKLVRRLLLQELPIASINTSAQYLSFFVIVFAILGYHTVIFLLVCNHLLYMQGLLFFWFWMFF